MAFGKKKKYFDERFTKLKNDDICKTTEKEKIIFSDADYVDSQRKTK